MFEDSLSRNALILLEILNDEIERQKFYLAGGSGLALQLGHRRSLDLDFLTPENFQPIVLSKHLEDNYKYNETLISKGTLYCELNNVKVSFLHYNVPLIFPKLKFKKIHAADWRDIMAEKFKTLSQRGSRKDFYDIYFCFKLKKKLAFRKGLDSSKEGSKELKLIIIIFLKVQSILKMQIMNQR
jgi:predicted nucleotidyltransferase component of viral defense system